MLILNYDYMAQKVTRQRLQQLKSLLQKIYKFLDEPENLETDELIRASDAFLQSLILADDKDEIDIDEVIKYRY